MSAKPTHICSERLEAEAEDRVAEERAATLREVVAWLREELRLALSHGNHDHAAIRRLEQRFTVHFNPQAER